MNLDFPASIPLARRSGSPPGATQLRQSPAVPSTDASNRPAPVGAAYTRVNLGPFRVLTSFLRGAFSTLYEITHAFDRCTFHRWVRTGAPVRLARPANRPLDGRGLISLKGGRNHGPPQSAGQAEATYLAGLDRRMAGQQAERTGLRCSARPGYPQLPSLAADTRTAHGRESCFRAGDRVAHTHAKGERGSCPQPRSPFGLVCAMRARTGPWTRHHAPTKVLLPWRSLGMPSISAGGSTPVAFPFTTR